MTLITDDMKTEWYSYRTQPVHIGEYEIRWYANSTTDVRYWDGKHWLLHIKPTRFVCENWVHSAFGARKGSEIEPQRAWRGLKAPHDGETS